jgi:hypothetical protein
VIVLNSRCYLSFRVLCTSCHRGSPADVVAAVSQQVHLALFYDAQLDIGAMGA